MKWTLAVSLTLLVGCAAEEPGTTPQPEPLTISPDSLAFNGAGSLGSVVSLPDGAEAVTVDAVSVEGETGWVFASGGLDSSWDLSVDGDLALVFHFGRGGIAPEGEHEAEAIISTSDGDYVIDLFARCGDGLPCSM